MPSGGIPEISADIEEFAQSVQSAIKKCAARWSINN
jgi:hypothetical protein